MKRHLQKHLLINWTVRIFGGDDRYFLEKSQYLCNETNVASKLANFLSVFTSIVYAWNYRGISRIFIILKSLCFWLFGLPFITIQCWCVLKNDTCNFRGFSQRCRLQVFSWSVKHRRFDSKQVIHALPAQGRVLDVHVGTRSSWASALAMLSIPSHRNVSEAAAPSLFILDPASKTFASVTNFNCVSDSVVKSRSNPVSGTYYHSSGCIRSAERFFNPHPVKINYRTKKKSA